MNDHMVVWNLIYVAACVIGLALFAFVFASTRGGQTAEETLDVAAWKKRENAWLYVVIAALVIMALFTLVEMKMPWQASAAADRVKVDATAQQFGFTLSQSTFKVGQQIEFKVLSKDVSHGFAVFDPKGAFVTQAQSLPDYATVLRMTPHMAGTYVIRCFEYCGVGHHKMVGAFEVKS